MDLLLDDSGDLALVNGDLVTVTGVDEIAQRVRVRLRLFAGEWFLAPDQGVPYFDRILGQKISKAALLSILREQVLACPGIASIATLEADVDSARRSVSVTLSATTTDGDPLAATLELP